MPIYCNPLNVPYHYQFNADPRQGGKLTVNREAADPSMVYYQGKYWLFPSMNLSVWVSEDLCHWESRDLPKELPLYGYAPDVRVAGEWLWFCASSREKCCYFRTKDVLNGPWEEFPAAFPFWDPNLFVDNDGRFYFYWGCSNTEPIRGVELDPRTMQPKGDIRELISDHPFEYGFERFGENHSQLPHDEAKTDKAYQEYLAAQHLTEEQVPADYRGMLRAMLSNRPYIEGAWMTKHDGKYYLQYACPGTEFNIYCDAVYVGSGPLGPFKLAESNPYSYKPGGFITGAGHGSTMQDREGTWWHTSTMHISRNHLFERRVGLWPAGFDGDGVLFCNQRYGDWPVNTEKLRTDPWADPEWMLLSYQKAVTASSCLVGHEPENAVNEDIRSWWRAAEVDAHPWLQVDLGEAMEVHAVQVNFADDAPQVMPPGDLQGDPSQPVFIDPQLHATRWLLEGSQDGTHYEVLKDKRQGNADLPHDLVVMEQGCQVRYLRLTVTDLPYGQTACVSGLRVFGLGKGDKPTAPVFFPRRTGDLDMEVQILPGQRTTGWVISWGMQPGKLYHSCMSFASEVHIGALVKGQPVYVRVDAFNESGIIHGETVRL